MGIQVVGQQSKYPCAHTATLVRWAIPVGLADSQGAPCCCSREQAPLPFWSPRAMLSSACKAWHAHGNCRLGVAAQWGGEGQAPVGFAGFGWRRGLPCIGAARLEPA
eukprot:1138307-Pelagomonas_calceolata.AAC.4